MRKITLLAAALALVLALATPAIAQGNEIVCPAGSVQDAAGTTCTDKDTGDFVEPVRSNIEFPSGPNCPESSPGNIYQERPDGSGCDLVGSASSADPCPDPNYPRQTPDGCQASDLPDVPQDDGIVQPPEEIPGSSLAAQYQYSAPSASPGVLPATGGPSLIALGAGILLVGGGIIARRIR